MYLPYVLGVRRLMFVSDTDTNSSALTPLSYAVVKVLRIV